ncbi:Transcriptional regulatory protein DpiA [Marinobacter litoralis]|uniref:Transcriptional regulatory protein n=1 Tax=Marinobacter litoralis TaxID=187981 RepID=A0A3M2RKF3_9GAMM|nr:response regulator [Marinobacter litoralis]RMJ05728.1 Transcriptional regulatory protein DpiA [Marinobacter litoralis]
MNTIRILIAEDDRQIAEIQRRFVERLDHVELCGIAHTLADARDLVDVLAPDLILLDVYFPDGSGLDLLRELRAQDSSSDVILIAAAKEVDTLRSALRGGVCDYILKPLVFERLEEAVSRFRVRLEHLSGLNQLAQNEVDALIPRPSEDDSQPPSGRLPKGIDALTLEKIQDVIGDGEPWSAEAVGNAIGASRTTARRYLEFMVGEGKLSAEVTYGSVGRPERRYQIVE